MAIFHFHTKVFGAGRGAMTYRGSVVAKAAYRAGAKLHDTTLRPYMGHWRRHSYNFSARAEGVYHSEILLPEGAPAWMTDREKLWNAVVDGERLQGRRCTEGTKPWRDAGGQRPIRQNAQFARELTIALPRELPPSELVELTRTFVREQFADKGMVVDFNIHRHDADNPHVHIMLTLREVAANDSSATWGPKVREWNDRDLYVSWRAAWAKHCNQAYAKAGLAIQIDHRTYEEQRIALVPTRHLGVDTQAGAGKQTERLAHDKRGKTPHLLAYHSRALEENARRIDLDPAVELKAVSAMRAVFTEKDLATHLFTHVPDADYSTALASCLGHESLIRLGTTAAGEMLYATEDSVEREARLLRMTDLLHARSRHQVSQRITADLSRRLSESDKPLSYDQEMALRHVLQSGDLAVVQGYAGAGKSHMLGAARAAWERQGYNVIGAALAGKAADGLQKDSGIQSRTLHSLLGRIASGRQKLTRRDIIVIDEASMVGDAMMGRLLVFAEAAGAKVVLVGDTRQLAAVDAGSAMQLIAERTGAAILGSIRRQAVSWQRAASKSMGEGRTHEGLRAYADRGHIVAQATRDNAVASMVEAWLLDRQDHPRHSQIMLAHRRDDVRELNTHARRTLVEADVIDAGVEFAVTGGKRAFAEGDRIVFGKNDARLGVKNGSLGTVVDLTDKLVKVRVDGAGNQPITIHLSQYRHIDHAYALTVHKTQGATADRTYVLASGTMDSALSYVAMTRHRHGATMYYAQDEFRTPAEALERISRRSQRISIQDFAEAYGVGLGNFEGIGDIIEERRSELGRMSTAALQGERKRLLEQADRDFVLPDAVRGHIDHATELYDSLHTQHGAVEAASTEWRKWRGDASPWQLTKANIGLGDGARTLRHLREQVRQRERTLRELAKHTRRAEARAVGQLLANEENGEIRRAQRDLATVEAILRERRIEELQHRLTGVEGEHMVRRQDWDAWRIGKSAALVTAAMKGRGPGGPVYRMREGVEQKVTKYRRELAKLTKTTARYFTPPDPPPVVPHDRGAIKEVVKLYELDLAEAHEAWELWCKTASHEDVAQARVGAGEGAALYQGYAEAHLVRRFVGREVAERILEGRLAALEPKLRRAEDDFMDVLRQGRLHLGKASEALDTLLEHEQALAELVRTPLPDIHAATLAAHPKQNQDAYVSLMATAKHRLADWLRESEGQPQDVIANARRGQGDFGETYTAFRDAADAVRVAALVRTSRTMSELEDRQLQLAEADTRARAVQAQAKAIPPHPSPELVAIKEKLEKLHATLQRKALHVDYRPPVPRAEDEEAITNRNHAAEAWAKYRHRHSPEDILAARLARKEGDEGRHVYGCLRMCGDSALAAELAQRDVHVERTRTLDHGVLSLYEEQRHNKLRSVVEYQGNQPEILAHGFSGSLPVAEDRMGIWRQVEEQQAICRRIEQRLGILPSTDVQRLEIAPVDMPATAHASELGRVTVDVLQKAFAASEAWERFKQYSPEAAAEAARTAPVDSGDKGATLYREMRIARKRTADLPRAINDAIDRADAALAEKNAREAVDDAERPRGRARKQAADEDILKL